MRERDAERGRATGRKKSERKGERGHERGGPPRRAAPHRYRYTVLSEISIAKVSDTAPLDVCSLLGCGVATGARAQLPRDTLCAHRRPCLSRSVRFPARGGTLRGRGRVDRPPGIMETLRQGPRGATQALGRCGTPATWRRARAWHVACFALPAPARAGHRAPKLLSQGQAKCPNFEPDFRDVRFVSRERHDSLFPFLSPYGFLYNRDVLSDLVKALLRHTAHSTQHTAHRLAHAPTVCDVARRRCSAWAPWACR